MPHIPYLTSNPNNVPSSSSADTSSAPTSDKMPSGFGTASVALATTPTVISTFFSHILAKPKRRSQAKQSLKNGGPGGGPENDFTYEEGLKVVRRFIDFSSQHGIEEVQAFTAMQVPTPHWVRRKVVTIPEDIINRAEAILTTHLSSYGEGIKLVGGEKWWRLRGRELEGEWIEMQKDYLLRKARLEQAEQAASGTSANPNVTAPTSRYSFLPRRSATLGSVKDSTGGEVIGDRVILYIHGGAFFFSSLDTHRYQVQRHARKAGARAFCPAYRLAPQYPFPCGLLDSLAAYLYLLYPPSNTHAPISPTSIIFMGDSAGGGMCISLLVLIREMGLPMPAGASLISPWVDLTHSMPSISGDSTGDFIPDTGFHYRPSCAWPPIPGDGIVLRMPDGTDRVYDEQVQMYCPNNLLTHPLVSPVNQGSLGGLCPLLILGGGGELLRDEIIYLAHKAANPSLYSPGQRLLERFPEQATLIDKYPPTKVHLQIHEGCCHVVPTLSWTKSAKHMYRACANFNIWAFTAASKALVNKLEKKEHKHRHQAHHGTNGTSNNIESPISSADPSRSSTLASDTSAGPPKLHFDIVMTDTETAQSSPTNTQPNSAAPSSQSSAIDLTKPIITQNAAAAANAEEIDMEDLESECSSSDEDASSAREPDRPPPTGTVSVTGSEPYPPPGEYIVAERVSTHGKIRPFEAISDVPALNPNLKEHIGQVHPDGAIQRWLAHRGEWDVKYTSAHEKWREIKIEDRALAEREGFLTRDMKGERPPLCSLAGWYDTTRAREVGKSVDEINKKTSGAVMMWMRMSSKADKEQAGGDTLGEIKKNVDEEMKDQDEGMTEGPEGQVKRQRRRSSVGTRGRRRSSVARPSSGIQREAARVTGADAPGRARAGSGAP